MNEISKTNINNLTQLWKTIGDSFRSYTEESTCSYCIVPHSEWPNRIWFTKEVTEEVLKSAIQIIKKSSIPLSVTHWNDSESTLEALFEKNGFIKKTVQTGMSLELRQKFKHSNRIVMEKVTTQKQATIWSEMYPKNFGYEIPAQILMNTQEKVEFYLINVDENPVGTALTYFTDNVMGVHCLGVLPEYRKQNIAGEAMAILLNNAIDRGYKFSTLQSSALGKNMYLRMGYSEDFLMKTYTYKQ